MADGPTNIEQVAQSIDKVASIVPSVKGVPATTPETASVSLSDKETASTSNKPELDLVSEALPRDRDPGSQPNLSATLARDQDEWERLFKANTKVVQQETQAEKEKKRVRRELREIKARVKSLQRQKNASG